MHFSQILAYSVIIPRYFLFDRNLTNKVVGDSSHPLMRHYYPDHYGESQVKFIWKYTQIYSIAIVENCVHF